MRKYKSQFVTHFVILDKFTSNFKSCDCHKMCDVMT